MRGNVRPKLALRLSLIFIWPFCTVSFNIKELLRFPRRVIHVLHVSLRLNGDCFSEQLWRTGLCDGDEMCCPWCSNGCFKYLVKIRGFVDGLLEPFTTIYSDLTSYAVLEYRLWVLYGTIEVTFYTGNCASWFIRVSLYYGGDASFRLQFCRLQAENLKKTWREWLRGWRMILKSISVMWNVRMWTGFIWHGM
jgi:hypothetical protein